MLHAWRFLLAAATLPLLLCGCLSSRPGRPEYPAYLMPSGILVRDQAIPEATLAASWGDLVTLDYTILLMDGTVADSSLERGQAITFRLGSGQVPRGLEEGIVGLPVLGRRWLGIPSELGYGAEGRPPRIPPNARLQIEIELLAIDRPSPLEGVE